MALLKQPKMEKVELRQSGYAHLIHLSPIILC
jgi:hypothetical protein